MELQALFGGRIRSIREAANLSRETVAERAKMSASYLGEVERGEKQPKLDMIERIATALKVLPSALFEYEAEEVDNNVLLSKLQRLLSDRNTEQLQQALRVLKALFPDANTVRFSSATRGNKRAQIGASRTGAPHPS
jgi:transcriptional regulator with XRE-family HTH domain